MLIKRKSYFIILSVLVCSFLTGCTKKDELSIYDVSIQNMKVFDDEKIVLPVEVISGNNCLLSAYNTSSADLIFNLTDNNGKLIWQKDFGIKYVTSMLKEADGTFTVISGARLINFNKEGIVLIDNVNFLSWYNTSYFIVRTVITPSNNYMMFGVYYTTGGSPYAFAAEVMHDGTVLFRKFYNINSTLTDCRFMADGGYLFYGNRYLSSINNSAALYILKTGPGGSTEWQKNHNLTTGNNTGAPVNISVYGFSSSAFTHEMVQIPDSNYLCFTNSPDLSENGQIGRIYKIDKTGNLLDSTFIQFGKFNRFAGGRSLSIYINSFPSFVSGNSVVKNNDGTLTICMQSGFFGSTGFTNSNANETQSFLVHIDTDLSIKNIYYLQNNYTDCFTSLCKTDDGNTVAFGQISSLGGYYKPVMAFINLNQ